MPGLGYPPFRTGLGSPSQDRTAVPPPPTKTELGYPPPLQSGQDWGTNLPTPGQDSRMSTCYAAGGMPLAVTQGDFLIHNKMILEDSSLSVTHEIFRPTTKITSLSQNQRRFLFLLERIRFNFSLLPPSPIV